MVQTAARYFSSIAEEYDEIARRGMPRREEMLDEVTRVLPEQAADVLELGCGTGALTTLLAQRYPNAKITAVDAAPVMITIARDRVNGACRLLTFRIAHFEGLALPRDGFDLIASNMALHHLRFKAPFYARLRAALRPGGVLVFGDELAGEAEYVHRRFWDAWVDFARQPGGLTEPEIADIIDHMERFDHYETLACQLEALREAGFTSVDCTWRYLNYGVFVAQA
jgi:tRNA (cmo5U34)-methyltransferase